MGTNVDLDYEDNEDGGKLGRLFFTVKYSFEKTALIVTINKCSNLPAKDKDNKTSDPYVKLQLLPEKQHKVKTRVVRRTLHPVYDEDFTFYGVHFNQLPILTLHFVVLSFDRYSRNLPKMDITGLSDPYVKIYLMYNGQQISKKRTLNPVFNESFVFDLPRNESGLGKVQLEFMLLDWDRVTKNEVIGRLELGGDGCEGPELAHWKEIQASPRRQIAEWHKLKE